MPTLPPPAVFDPLYFAAAALYLAYLLVELTLPRYRAVPLALGVLAHAGGLVARAVGIAFLPLTNKFESFYAFSFACFAMLLWVTRSPSRVHRLGLFLVAATFYGLTFIFERALFYPPPLMKTLWYPLHVPASFWAYALWVSAAMAGVSILLGRDAPRLRAWVDDHAFWGWCVFSVSMIFGGAWGYVAWGAYFLWDPKVVWSVILWLFYSGFVHLRYWPAGNQPRPKSALAIAGMLVMAVAYVGTSFFFHHGSHSWS